MKRKLFLVLCALLTMIGVQAQKDVTSTYITNATLSSLTGWTNVNFNTPVSGNGTIKIGNTNYQSYNTVGYATECYEGWSSVEKSEFSLTQTITLPAGEYTLVNYSFFREGQNYNTDASTSRAYLKAGDNKVLVKTLGSITASGYANSQAEGAVCFDSKMYRNTLDFTIAADNTEIEIGVYGTFNTEITKSWMILGKFELIKTDEPATMDAPFDVTGYITNPGFEYRDMSGWTLSESGAFGAQINNQSFKTGLHYGEKWQASGALTARSMSQTLTDLPAGYYKLTANLGGDGTYIDLNGKTVNWTEDGNYTTGYVLAENEDLTITAGKTAEGSANWIHFDNFKLQFCGDVQAALTTLIAQLSGYEGTIPSAAYSALQTAVAVYDKDYSDVDELLDAIDDVQALYDAADLLKTPYATWLSAKSTAESNYSTIACITAVKTAQNTIVEAATDAATITSATSELNTAMSNYDAYVALDAKADILVAVANDNSDANSTLATAISTAATNVETCTTADAINTVTSTLKTAMQTYVFAANPVGDGAQFDCTFMLTNPDLTGLPTWTGAAGWYTEQDGGNSQVMTNDGAAGPHGNAFYEYWSEAAAANNKFALYQKVTLPEGTYSMECDAFSSQATGGDNCAVYFYANDTQGDLVNNYPMATKTISFVNGSEQEVKIGLKALAGNTYRWMGIGYVKLYKVPAQTYTVDEDQAWDNSQSGAGDVTLNRTIKVGVNTLVLPFSMTQAEVESTFGAGSKVYAVSSYNAGTENISFAVRDGISANQPCLLKATEAGTTYDLTDRTIVAGTPTSSGTNVTLTGSYAASISVPQGANNYIVSGDMLYQVNSSVTMKNTRAYITISGGDSSARLSLSFDDDSVTAINTIESAETTDAAPKDGKFLENGKIVIVKNGVKYSANGQILK